MYCDNCGTPLPEDSIFCPNCGTRVSLPKNDNDSKQDSSGQMGGVVSDTTGTYSDINKPDLKKRCPYCGTELDDDAIFCAVCGHQIVEKMDDHYNTPYGASIPPSGNNKKKNNTVIILIIVIIIAVVLGGFAAAVKIFDIDIMSLFGSSEDNNTKGSDISSTQTVETTAPAAAAAPAFAASPAPTPTMIPAPTPTVYAPPVFDSVTASSTRGVDRTDGNNNYYYPEYAVDGKYETAWTPLKAQYDSTPWIQLSSTVPQYVSGIEISNGYFKSQNTYTKNNRITKFLVEYEGGQKVYTCGTDQYMVMQNIKFDAPALTSYVKITVLETYNGVWNDVAISEIRVY